MSSSSTPSPPKTLTPEQEKLFSEGSSVRAEEFLQLLQACDPILDRDKLFKLLDKYLGRPGNDGRARGKWVFEELQNAANQPDAVGIFNYFSPMSYRTASAGNNKSNNKSNGGNGNDTGSDKKANSSLSIFNLLFREDDDIYKSTFDINSSELPAKVEIFRKQKSAYEAVKSNSQKYYMSRLKISDSATGSQPVNSEVCSVDPILLFFLHIIRVPWLLAASNQKFSNGNGPVSTYSIEAFLREQRPLEWNYNNYPSDEYFVSDSDSNGGNNELPKNIFSVQKPKVGETITINKFFGSVQGKVSRIIPMESGFIYEIHYEPSKTSIRNAVLEFTRTLTSNNLYLRLLSEYLDFLVPVNRSIEPRNKIRTTDDKVPNVFELGSLVKIVSDDSSGRRLGRIIRDFGNGTYEIAHEFNEQHLLEMSRKSRKSELGETFLHLMLDYWFDFAPIFRYYDDNVGSMGSKYLMKYDKYLVRNSNINSKRLISHSDVLLNVEFLNSNARSATPQQLYCVLLVVQHILRDNICDQINYYAETSLKFTSISDMLVNKTKKKIPLVDSDFLTFNLKSIQQPLFDLIRTSFKSMNRRNLEAFQIIVDIWLMYITPWNFDLSYRNKFSTSPRDVYDRWAYFIAANYHFYTALFVQFLQFVSTISVQELTSNKSSLLMYIKKVFQVFDKHLLGKLAEICENLDQFMRTRNSDSKLLAMLLQHHFNIFPQSKLINYSPNLPIDTIKCEILDLSNATMFRSPLIFQNLQKVSDIVNNSLIVRPESLNNKVEQVDEGAIVKICQYGFMQMSTTLSGIEDLYQLSPKKVFSLLNWIQYFGKLSGLHKTSGPFSSIFSALSFMAIFNLFAFHNTKSFSSLLVIAIIVLAIGFLICVQTENAFRPKKVLASPVNSSAQATSRNTDLENIAIAIFAEMNRFHGSNTFNISQASGATATSNIVKSASQNQSLDDLLTEIDDLLNEINVDQSIFHKNVAAIEYALKDRHAIQKFSEDEINRIGSHIRDHVKNFAKRPEIVNSVIFCNTLFTSSIKVSSFNSFELKSLALLLDRISIFLSTNYVIERCLGPLRISNIFQLAFIAFQIFFCPFINNIRSTNPSFGIWYFIALIVLGIPVFYAFNKHISSYFVVSLVVFIVYLRIFKALLIASDIFLGLFFWFSGSIAFLSLISYLYAGFQKRSYFIRLRSFADLRLILSVGLYFALFKFNILSIFGKKGVDMPTSWFSSSLLALPIIYFLMKLFYSDLVGCFGGN